jgi:ABC-type phosphate transport system substrate-binding protein
MTRATLLRTLSFAAFAAAQTPCFAQTPTAVQGGGATASQGDYVQEFATYNASTSGDQFSTYWGSGSGTGQQAFLQDDLTCDINKVTGANGGHCSNTPGGLDTVHYGAADNPLNSTQIATWATSSFGQSSAGNLIQLPSMGTAPAIAVNDTNVTKNGKLELSDNDLCGIFSGLITDFSQITDSATLTPAAGQFKLVYRSDSSGTTFLLTNHLAAVCNAGNTNPGVTFSAVTTFASLFTALGGIATVIPNSVPETLSEGIANYMAGLSNGPVPQAIGYVTPDWTSLDPDSESLLSNGEHSPLFVAAIFNGSKAYTPTTKNIENGLKHPTLGTNLTPPANATEGANPALWVPVIQTVSVGYPIVGYTTLDLAQCYFDPAIFAAIKAYLTDHYEKSTYSTIQTENGLVSVADSGAAKFLATIKKNILANKNNWNTNIGNSTACAGLAGR